MDYLKIGSKKIETLLAVSTKEQEKGLMEVLPPPPVMTFIYASPRINQFWMHRTPSPLDIVFCLKGKVASIAYGEPFSTKLIGGHSLSDLVVEFPAGYCKANNIKEGDEIELEYSKASLMRVFMLKNGIIY